MPNGVVQKMCSKAGKTCGRLLTVCTNWSVTANGILKYLHSRGGLCTKNILAQPQVLHGQRARYNLLTIRQLYPQATGLITTIIIYIN